MAIQVGIDIGGTFTDFVVYDSTSHQFHFFKVPSTKPPEKGVLDGLERLKDSYQFALNKITRVVHGSTVATNALIENKWAKTALITTQGFRDVLEIGRQQRDVLYDFKIDRVRPIVPREWRIEVPERVDASGRVVTPLDEHAVIALIDKLREVDAVAIVFLFSYLKPAHEKRVKELLIQELEIPVVCSSDVLSEYREYERTSTAVVNASLRPIVGGYIETLASELKEREIKGSFEIMQSNGGLVDAAIAKDHSEHLLFSGPAGGVAATQYFGALMGFDNLIAFDMGGTSCDVSLIANGRALQRVESKLAGYEVRVPMVDIHSVGAGGGSIAWIDTGGAVRVGPHSAGATPGPASYGTRGAPTVTDAQLMLGRFDPVKTLADLELQKSRSEEAIRTKIAEPLSLRVEEAAYGIIEIADANMERAIRVISVERGHDPREYALLAFGGGGPLHGCAVAEKLGIKTVIVPSTAGVLSALGMLLAHVKRDRVQSVLKSTQDLKEEEIEAQFSQMKEQIESELGERASGKTRFNREVELRYRGQAYEIPVPAEREFKMATIEHEFNERHQTLFGYVLKSHPTEVVSLRLEGVVKSADIKLPKLSQRSGKLEPKGTRVVCFKRNESMETAIYERDSLLASDEIEGPAMIEGSESTILMPIGWNLVVDEYGSVILSR